MTSTRHAHPHRDLLAGDLVDLLHNFKICMEILLNEEEFHVFNAKLQHLLENASFKTLQARYSIDDVVADISDLSLAENKNNGIESKFEINVYCDILELVFDSGKMSSWISLSVLRALLLTYGFDQSWTILDKDCLSLSLLTPEVKTYLDMLTSSPKEHTLDKQLESYITALESLSITANNFIKSIAILITLLESDSSIDRELLPYLKRIIKPDVLLLSNQAKDCSVSNVINSNLSIKYSVQKDKVDFSIKCGGIFAEGNDLFVENFTQVFSELRDSVAAFSLALQMNALKSLHILNDLEGRELGFALSLHGGAGNAYKYGPCIECPDLVVFSLRAALSVGASMLAEGLTSVEAVEATVISLENCLFYNAGKGSVFNSEGQHELEASIMDGSTKKCGAVALLRRIKNPVSAARVVMDKTPHIFIAGEAAETLSIMNGLEVVSNTQFDTHFRKQHLIQAQDLNQYKRHTQTVGAAALDNLGNLAAATSTGGLVNKFVGRIGDSPIIGAGNYANEQMAVSCTGQGEMFMKNVVAFDVAKVMEYKHLTLETACEEVIAKSLSGSNGGMVAVDKEGNVAEVFNTGILLAASLNKNGKLTSHMLKRL